MAQAASGAGPVNAGIASLQPYRPGRGIDEVARELGLADMVKLASNEPPRGPAAVRRRIREGVADLPRYPDGAGRLNAFLMRRLAELTEAPVEAIDQHGWDGDAVEASAWRSPGFGARRKFAAGLRFAEALS